MILLDLNVLLDVLQKREPHYRSSSAVLERIIYCQERGLLAAHAVTTAHYLISRYHNQKKANEVTAWLLTYFEIAPVGREELSRAHGLGWKDFEDAVVASAAQSAGCTSLITRNVKDFRQSPVPAFTPDEYLLQDDRHEKN